uniref:Uncharacterized protein n=1 Tax=Panagrolaimus sp. PS1159 TaxID=55785 RepID=A0AC35FXD0_9BILA
MNGNYLLFIFFFVFLITSVKSEAVRTDIVENILLRRPDNAACNSACGILGHGGGQYQCCYETVAQDGTITYQPKCVCSG